ncbi:MAG: hypothetical protein SVK08_00135 [Halobacteriota archaeon]|nr:hypothetical protein [Halobacteriota archaeon]
MSTSLGVIIGQLLLKGCLKIEDELKPIVNRVMVSAQAIENAASVLSAAGKAQDMKNLYFPIMITEDMVKQLEDFAGKEFVVSG